MEPMELDELREGIRDAIREKKQAEADSDVTPEETEVIPPSDDEDLYCPECGAGPFKSPRGVTRHVTEMHVKEKPDKEPRRKPPRPTPPAKKRGTSVQMALFLGYRLTGAAFASWGPEPVNVRQTVGGSMVMTAGPAAAGMDRVAKRTPFYPILEAVCSATGVVDDLMPLGIPLVLGMYGYSPQAARQRMRPLMGQALTMMFASLFGVEMPVEEQAQAVTQGIEPTPEGMQQLAEALLGSLEMSDGTAAPAAA